MDVIEKFKNKYIDVIDSNGDIKTCGRDNCEELIKLAQKIKPGNYGDLKTGFIKKENLIALYNEVK